MATEKLIAGGVSAYTDLGAVSGLNSLVNTNACVISTDIDNSSNLDLLIDISISLGSITPTGTPYLALYLYPLNQDTSTYGDGRFGSSAAGPPPSPYWIGNIPLVTSAGVQVGSIEGVVLPRGNFKIVACNVSGVTLASSSNTAKYRTTNRQVS